MQCTIRESSAGQRARVSDIDKGGLRLGWGSLGNGSGVIIVLKRMQNAYKTLINHQTREKRVDVPRDGGCDADEVDAWAAVDVEGSKVLGKTWISLVEAILVAREGRCTSGVGAKVKEDKRLFILGFKLRC